LNRLLRSERKYTWVAAKALLLQAYQQDYGIFDHVDQARKDATNNVGLKKPLASIAMHDVEEVVGTSDLVRVLREFSALKVYERYGLNLEEFLSQPKYICDEILLECREHQTGIANALKDVDK
jgi:hypothetical protein